MDDPTLTVLALLALAGLFAGFVDAVVGGGGLVQLPALLLGLPGASPVQVLATNKLASICGTTVSSATYYRRIRPDPRTFLPLMLLAFVGSAIGAVVAGQVPRSAFEPLVLVALVLVGGYVLFRPRLGQETALRFAGHHHTAAAMGTGLAVGFYDGVLGPGTGSFFVFLFVRVLGYDFLHASASAKLLNTATNLAALVLFALKGHVWWHYAVALAVANVAGSLLGTHLALKHGASFVRVVFILVVGALILKTGYDAFQIGRAHV